MTIEKLIILLNDKNVGFDGHGYTDIESPFEISPSEYFTFAERDINEKDKRGLVNALSNAKRALNCQIDLLLYSFCLLNYSNKHCKTMPLKIDLLNKLGIVAPRILKKINSKRNLMEHEYACPNTEEVEDFMDMVLLFNSYTNKFLYNTPTDFSMCNGATDFYVTAEFQFDTQIIEITIRFENNNYHIELKPDKNNLNLFIEYLVIHHRIFMLSEGAYIIEEIIN